ncbi:MAG: hypothetical protein LBL32_01110 [Holosporales bacterium]|nr:hypothetical protein [Holosporales bacterium]
MGKKVFLLFFLLIQSAHADVIFPMFAFKNPVMIALIVPIVLIEYEVMKRYLPKMDRRKMLRTATISNVLSSVVGYPILIVASMLIGLFFEITIRPIICMFWTNSSYPCAVLFCIPIILTAFLLSCFIEYMITRRCLQREYPENTQEIKRAVKYANMISYAFLIGCIVLLEMYSWYFKKDGFLIMYYYQKTG